MKKPNIVCLALFSIMTIAMMSSCDRENLDMENLDPDELVIIPEIINPPCDSIFMSHLGIDWDKFGFPPQMNNGSYSKAYLFKNGTNCDTEDSTFDLNFQVVLSRWNSFGRNPSILDSSEGIPGYSFGMNSNAQVGDVITMWRNHMGAENLFQIDGSSDMYSFNDDYELLLSDVGDEFGESIGGWVTGSVTNLRTNESSDFSGGFCSVIAYVCE